MSDGVAEGPRMEERDALAESAEQFRRLVEGMPLLVCSTLADGTITFINELAAAVAGRPAADLVGENVGTLVGKETADLVATAREELTADHPVETHEESLQAADGSTLWLEWTNRGSFDDEGRLVRVQSIGRDVTERRRAEEELRESREVLRAVLDAIPVRVFWKDEDLRYLGCNVAFARDAGFASPEDVIGKDDYAMGWREQADLYRADDRLVIERGEAQLGIEEPQTTPSGDQIALLTSKMPLRDANGGVVGVLGTYLDITERQRAEQQAEEWRDLMQLIIEHDPNAIAVFDDKMRYVFVSDRFLDDFGVRSESVIGKCHYDVFPDIPDSVRMVHQRVLQGAVERSEEDPFQRADGHVDWVSWQCRPWHKADGAIGGIILYSELITERRAAAKELRQSRRQYETFINATDDIAFLKDDRLRYVMGNTATARFFGRSAEEILGRSDDELMPAAAADACRASDLQAIQSGTLVVTTEKQGDRVFESRKFPVALTDGRTGVGGYVRDVTEQRRAEEEIRRLAADLERRVMQRTAQLEATNGELEAFAYSISHDLRSPLRALDGFSEILLQDYGESLDDTGRDHLRRIKSAANHMAGLMDGLLQLSRLNRDELVFQEVDLTGLAESLVAELRERDPARDVVVDVAPDLVAQADPKLMRSVIENLLGNAWKFTARHETAHIQIGAVQLDDAKTFFVRDDGAGFDMRYAGSLFGAFQRLHTPDQFEGTGIGLATVQRIVHRHGGTVWAEGEVEKGATFWFTLGPPDA